MASTPLRQFVQERFPQPDDDDDSSAAMDDFLSSRMDAAMQESPLVLANNNEWPDVSLEKSTIDKPRRQEEEEATLPPSSGDQDEPPEQTDGSTAASTGSGLSTGIYNPFTNYSPLGRTRSRREIMGMSIPIFPASPMSITRSTRAQTEPCLHLPEDDDDDDAHDDTSIDSERKLERWANQIRVELRHAEMVEMACEAERAAEAGITSFAAKLSTYGRDDSLLAVPQPAFSTKKKKPMMIKRRKSFSEGTQIPLPRSGINPKVGVMALRDVNEVFPPFGQFHDHLRTHFKRGKVHEKTLSFHESKKSTKGSWGTPTSSPGHHHRLSSDFFTQQFKHQRSPSDFFKHQRTPSDFFQGLNVERWLQGVGSTDTAESGVYGELLADHSYASSSKRRSKPKVVVPPGLEMPDLTIDTSSIRKKKKRGPKSGQQSMEPLHPSLSFERRAMRVPPRELSPNALFDGEDDDIEEESETASQSDHQSSDEAASRPPPPPFPSPLMTPANMRRRRASETLQPDFVTPARLRVIRAVRKQSNTEPAQSAVESLLLSATPTDSTVPESIKQPLIPSPGASPLLLLPTHLSDKTDGASLVNVGIQPRVRARPADVPPKTEPEATLAPLSLEYKQQSPPMSTFARQHPLLTDAVVSGELDEAPKTPVIRNHDEGDAPTTPNAPLREQDDSFQTPISEQHDSFLEEPATPEPMHRRSQRVQVLVYGASPDSDTISFRSGRGIQQTLSQSMSIQDSEDARERKRTVTRAAAVQPDCGCLELPDPCSPASAPEEDDKSMPRPSMLRRSSSAGALASMDSPRNKWNPFSSGKGESPSSKPFQAAMSMFSRISPVKRGKGRYLPSKENDDFLHNYMYCSKPKESSELTGNACAEPFQTSCADFNQGMCCASLFADSALGDFLSGDNDASGGPILSLGGNATYTKIEPETWFDVATEKFDGVLEQLAGRARHKVNPWNVSFRAPSLRKLEVPPEKKRTYSIADEDAMDAFEEKKLDDDSCRTPPSPRGRHARHLSLFPSLETNQFENIYGLSPEALADSLTRNWEATELAGEGKADYMADDSAELEEFDPLVANQTF